MAGAKERLDRLDLYPEPVRIDRVRLTVFPAFFRVPGFRRYRGYTLWRTILLREPPGEGASDLLTHELCHLWQMQHRPWAAMWAWIRYRYADNPFEREARQVVAETRSG